MSNIVLLDGAAGSALQNAGLRPGESSFVMNVRAPETVRELHRAYADAGSRVVYTNTFALNAISARKTGYSVRELVRSGVEIAKSVVGFGKVALDIGPIGLEIGDDDDQLSPDAAYAMFAEVVEIGAKAGADIVVIETMYDLDELKIALRAARESADLPVYVCMTFNTDGHTFLGVSVADFVAAVEEIGADAIGLNCSYGPSDIFPVFEQIAALTKLPLIAKPNAGLPDENGEYTLTPEEFARQMRPFIDAGAKYIGGCCGSTPAFITALRREFAD
ncbi:MAG: homocysteine S-methyltransferase family protein [Oscillospiraceae bacterium]|jgi:5-methyltetrahydrofolate--homocysteine methyltransferase|nr:homocysteine S-methyltransferase family protein [Oscillospiraceae bacterium]